jgi:hypothetical protein
MIPPATPRPATFPRGLTAMGIFLVFGACMASLAGLTLAFPGTALDRIWLLNPRAYKQLAPLGKVVGAVFLLLAIALATAAAGWFKRRVWGRRLAIAIIAIQIAGDSVNALSGHLIEGGIGVAIASALLFYLLRAEVKNAFAAAEPRK